MLDLMSGWAIYAALTGPAPLPPLTDLQRFPVNWLVQINLGLGKKHLDYLAARWELELPNRPDIALQYAETRRCMEPWILLSGVIDGYDEWQGVMNTHNEQGRRQRLAELRNVIGWRAYYEGSLPPPVPLWRFRQGEGLSCESPCTLPACPLAVKCKQGRP